MSKEPFDRPPSNNPERPFTGWWIPVEIIQLFDSRLINLKEMVLLSIIGNLSKTKDGCMMSNNRLGKEMGVSDYQITTMLSHLRELDCIKEIGFDGRVRKLKVSETLHRGKPRGCIGENPEAALKKTPRLNREKPLPYNKGENKGEKPCLNKSKQGGTSESAPSARKGFLSTEFDDKAAALLREVLVIHDSDLVAPPRGVRLATLSKSIKSLRLSGRTTATEHNILEVIKWLRKNYGDEHTPKMHKANDFADHWGRFRSAWIRDVGEESAVVSAKSSSPEDREARVAKHELKKLVVDKIVEQQGRNAMFDFRDRDIRRALAALGEDPDTLTEKDWEL